jgi:hypothetical protein
VLPPTGWTWLASVEGGQWGQAGAEPVTVAASMGLEHGIWFRVRQGIRGLLVRDEHGVEAAYMLCEPASHYFAVMTAASGCRCWSRTASSGQAGATVRCPTARRGDDAP